MKQKQLRAVSWWLRWSDLEWPLPDHEENIKRRADAIAEADVNTVIFFGAHFRWDYLPLWERLHDHLAFIAEELHQRKIQFIDHHSATLTHRQYEKKSAIGLSGNRHHVAFHPSAEAAADWTIHGHHLNDWRMKNLVTGKPDFLPKYCAEEFCMNNPVFQEEYAQYVKRLIRETNIDGLMADDVLFFNGLRSCGCPHCLERFGNDLPPVSDFSFWCNWENPEFRRWIQMRYASGRDFYARIASILPEKFKFLHCCGSSYSAVANLVANTYEDYIPDANIIAFEMGDLHREGGNVDSLIPSQLFNLALGKLNDAESLSLAYGFSKDTADFLWSYNKFCGVGTWFSTHKGRLRLPDAIIAQFPDEPPLIRGAYEFESKNPELFHGESCAECAVIYSRATRDNHGGWDVDYSRDFGKVCQQLLHAGVNFDILTGIADAPASRYATLILPSMICMSESDRKALDACLQCGKKIFASGPLAVCDAENNPNAAFPSMRIRKNPRPCNGFPPDVYENLPPIYECENPPQWQELKPGLLWHPLRNAPLSPVFAQNHLPPSGWLTRSFRLSDGSIATHYLASACKTEKDDELERRRYPNPPGLAQVSIIRHVSRADTVAHEVELPPCRIYFPPGQPDALKHPGGMLQLPAEIFYFIVRR